MGLRNAGKKRKTLLFVSLYFCFQSLAWGIDHPIRELKKLEAPEPENVVRVNTAKIVLADYDLIKRDFPQLAKLENAQIDAWILDKTAYISATQIKSKSGVNTKVDFDGASTIKAHRPSHYGRALVFDAGTGLIDAKGVGAVNPAQASHQNGLATLGECLREFTYEKMIQQIAQHHKTHTDPKSKMDTVGTYAVIDWGFDVIHNDQSKSPAGAVLRQAHDRAGDPKSKDYNFMPLEKVIEVEKVLRSYGVTSAGTFRQACDYADLQGTKDHAIVDFGTFLTEKKFVNFLRTMVDDDWELSPDSQDFVQPKEDIRLPFELWGYERIAESRYDHVRMISDAVAQKLRTHELNRDQAQEVLKRFFLPVLEKWAKLEKRSGQQTQSSISCNVAAAQSPDVSGRQDKGASMSGAAARSPKGGDHLMEPASSGAAH